MHGSWRPWAAPTRTRKFAALGVVALVASFGVWFSAGAAQAAVTSFVVSPGSGPPGTVVHVSGSGCTPGLIGSKNANFVAVTATTLDVAFEAPVAPSGSWSGTFTVPAGARVGSTAPVTAVCWSTGLPSLMTLYTPQSFRVTGASPTTNPPPTTGPGSGTTQPPGTTPGTIVTIPGDSATVISPPSGDGAIGASGTPDGSGGSANAATPGTAAGGPAANGGGKRADAAGAATLQQADLGALSAAGTGDGGLGWLGWALLLAVLLAAIGASGLIWRARQARESAEPIGDAS
jgi:hypothetical protein